MVFRSDKQRKAFFAKSGSRTSAQPNIIKKTFFSYRDGKKLGQFQNLNQAFKRFPSEKKAFDRVIKFRKKTGIQVNTIQEIKSVKRSQKMVKNIPKRWDR